MDPCQIVLIMHSICKNGQWQLGASQCWRLWQQKRKGPEVGKFWGSLWRVWLAKNWYQKSWYPEILQVVLIFLNLILSWSLLTCNGKGGVLLHLSKKDFVQGLFEVDGRFFLISWFFYDLYAFLVTSQVVNMIDTASQKNL